MKNRKRQNAYQGIFVSKFIHWMPNEFTGLVIKFLVPNSILRYSIISRNIYLYFFSFNFIQLILILLQPKYSYYSY